MQESRFDVPEDRADCARSCDLGAILWRTEDVSGQACGRLFENAAPLIPTENMTLAAAGMGLSRRAIGHLDIPAPGKP